MKDLRPNQQHNALRKLDLFFLVLGILMLFLVSVNHFRTGSSMPTASPLALQSRMDYLAIQRAYPREKIHDSDYFIGFNEMRKNSGQEKALNAPDVWRSIGPKNQAGRTISLAVHPWNPNIVYAGSASGGLWRLTITGDEPGDYSWEHIQTGYPVLGVGAIAINPKDPDVMYIGTGEVYGYQGKDGDLFGSYWMRIRGNYGIGVLKTIDGGKSWEKSIDWTRNQSRGVLSLAIDPVNPDVVFAGTTEGVYRTKNAGLTWEHIHSVVMAVDVKINPNNPNLIFASCGNLGTPGHGIYRSLDQGETWTLLTKGLPTSWTGKTKLDIFPSSPSTVYADICNQWERIGLYASEDAGKSWQLLSTMEGVDLTQNQGYFSHFVRVNPHDQNKIFIAKVGYQYSNDGGKTFTKANPDITAFVNDPTIAHVDLHAFANHPQEPDSFFIAGDGGVYLTKDGGITFRNLNNGYVSTQFYQGFACSSTDPNLAVGGMQDNGSALYLGIPDWKLHITPGDGGYAAIDPTNNDIVYASSQRLIIQRSSNRFIDIDNWEYSTPFLILDQNKQPHGTTESVAFIAPFVLAEHDKLYAATNYVYRSEDGGRTWAVTNGDRPLNELPVVAMAVAKSDTDVVYAATAPYNPLGVRPEIFITRDGGRNWANITGNLPDRYIVDIAISSVNTDIVYVALSGFGSPHLYRSLNGGLYTWENISFGLPDVPTSAIAIDPKDHRIIYLGNDLGIWVSTDFGNSWNVFREGLPEAVLVMDLSISEEARIIRAATHGNGVFERTLLPSGGKSIKKKR
jgi:photosystem II stability/assembly factor-like uncharacterized protein